METDVPAPFFSEYKVLKPTHTLYKCHRNKTKANTKKYLLQVLPRFEKVWYRLAHINKYKRFHSMTVLALHKPSAWAKTTGDLPMALSRMEDGEYEEPMAPAVMSSLLNFSSQKAQRGEVHQ